MNGTVCCIFLALLWNSNKAYFLPSLHPFLLSTKSNSRLSISYTVREFPVVILFCGCQVYKYILIDVIPVDETILFPTLNPLTAPKTFMVNFLSLSVGATAVKPLLSVASAEGRQVLLGLGLTTMAVVMLTGASYCFS